MGAALRKQARQIVERLVQAGHQALFAGGSVRDMLRGEEPHDIDVATDATPGEVEALFERTVSVGSRFGVVVVLLGGNPFEVATFRTETGYADSRHPDEVEFADAEADSRRRDFTINGLFYDPLEDEVIDYVGGRADIEAGRIRAIGSAEARFAEDALRLLRATRFAARFGYRIERRTRQAIEQHAANIAHVSAERVREELTRILTGPNAGTGLRLLHETGLLQHILPEVEAMVGCAQPENFHPEGDVFAHTRLCLDALPDDPPPALAWAALLHDVGKPPTFSKETGDRIRFNNHDAVSARLARRICGRLRFSTEQTNVIADLVAQHMKFLSVNEMRESTLKRFLRSPHIDLHLELHRADCVASHGDLANYQFCVNKLDSLEEEDIRPPRLLTGDDLIELGYSPGPIFSEILERVEDAQLEGDIESRDDALELVRSEFPRRQDTRR
jgi:poly(A) polymerase